MFEISNFIEKDTEQWIKLWTSFEDGNRSLEECKDICSKNWPRILNDETCHALALRLKENSLAVGFITYAVYWCAFTDQDECYVSGLSVLPEWRGKGGGKLLMDTVIQYGKKNNFKRITWLTNDNHPEAIALYDKIAEKQDWIRYKVNL